MKLPQVLSLHVLHSYTAMEVREVINAPVALIMTYSSKVVTAVSRAGMLPPVLV